MFISEIYHSNQGEGLLSGTPSIFVRTSGCNLRCGFCDTPYASWAPEGQHLDLSAVVDRVREIAGQTSAQHIVLTGGEPMLPAAMVDLCDRLSQAGLHLTMETAGTIFRDLKCDLMSISPKLSNSTPDRGRAGRWLEKHESARHRPDIVQQLIQSHPYQLKFVIANRGDLDEVDRYLSLLATVDPHRVLLMPEGVTQSDLAEKEPWMVDACQQRGFTFCQRQHIFWYGNQRGT